MIRFAKGVYIIAALVRTWVIIRYSILYVYPISSRQTRPNAVFMVFPNRPTALEQQCCFKGRTCTTEHWDHGGPLQKVVEMHSTLCGVYE